jgi:hypothetical protein
MTRFKTPAEIAEANRLKKEKSQMRKEADRKFRKRAKGSSIPSDTKRQNSRKIS